MNFNPRSPHGERRELLRMAYAEADFNPRSPHGERHNTVWLTRESARISIHALLTESDVALDALIPPTREFQSTLSSRRATSDAGNWIITDEGFQSTLSSRRATE